MNALIKLCLGVILVGIVFLAAFGYKNLKKKDSQEEGKEKPLIHTSRRGSIIFYSFLGALSLFILIMYIIWRIKYC